MPARASSELYCAIPRIANVRNQGKGDVAEVFHLLAALIAAARFAIAM
jgi:hypothetical protein